MIFVLSENGGPISHENGIARGVNYQNIRGARGVLFMEKHP